MMCPMDRTNDRACARPLLGKPDKAAEWRAKLLTEQDTVASDPPEDEKQYE